MSRKEDAELQAIPDMVRDLVRRAESKLAELETRRQHLRQRLLAFRFLSARSAESGATERQDNSAPTRSDSDQDRKPAAPDRDAGKITTRLRRACRIALLESDKPQTAGEIYRRISKRGSLSFQRSSDPLQLLSAELERMATECEITCRLLDGVKHWQRRSLE